MAVFQVLISRGGDTHMLHQSYIDIAAAYGWHQIPSKNPLMVSFVHDDKGARMNVYHTTMTVTIQQGDEPCITHREVDSLELFESVLI